MIDEQKTLRMLDYRLQSIDIFNWALDRRSKWDEAPPITVYIDGVLTLEGNLNAITNPMMEIGILHCRALLEFLGLRLQGKHIRQIDTRHNDDIGIEHFSNANGPLMKVDPQIALSRYGGGPTEAENALVRLFQLANKELAHSTTTVIEVVEDSRLIEVASRGVSALMVSYFYTPLGLPSPSSKITRRDLKISTDVQSSRP